MTTTDDFLAHYGVKGMKWGVRHEVGPSGRVTNQLGGKSLYATDAALAVTAFVGIRAYHSLQSGRAQDIVRRGQAYVQKRSVTDYPINPALARKNMSADAILTSVVKPINPGFGQFGTRANCRRATFAYELRRRGMDVRATRTSNASGQNAAGFVNAVVPGSKLPTHITPLVFKYATESAKYQKDPNYKSHLLTAVSKGSAGALRKISDATHEKIYQELAKEPERSRGELGISWAAGGGHSMAYEIINRKPVVFDAQSGHKFHNSADFGKHVGPISDAAFSRLDNLQLNQEFLSRWVVSAPKKNG